MPSTQFALCELGLTCLKGHLPIFGCSQPTACWALCLCPVFLLSDSIFKITAAAFLSLWGRYHSRYRRPSTTSHEDLRRIFNCCKWWPDRYRMIMCILYSFVHSCVAPFSLCKRLKEPQYIAQINIYQEREQQIKRTQCCREKLQLCQLYYLRPSEDNWGV